ncbi:MAG: aminodeoxychorismate lyase [Betaproteobacteria bacterium RIFCSPLOWO2_02_FULL_62_17]|nr:MAG: aminodeoxychorismate lyase [Betaproteobacteria bacterium RIFCSPLOWO2_02_FULL_62_17]
MFRALRILVLFCFAGAAAFFAWLIAFAAAPLELPADNVEFSILTGSSLRAATRQITEAGIPVSEAHFNLLARLTGNGARIKAGSYELARGASPWELLRKITLGDVLLREVLFVEGWTFAQMRAALDALDAVRHDTRELSDTQVMERLGVPSGRHAEGMFFPDTYLFAKGESDLKILARAYRLMGRKLEQAWEARGDGLPYKTPYEALILASIVEKETGDPAERAIIAGVFSNRLRIGMRLQTDPTVIYGMGENYKGNIRKDDLERDTPFNTYTRAGLPPHPIAMPGLAALRAAVNPAKTDAIYFAARGDGSHQFSRTLDEHNRAVLRFQKKGRP